jgi:hypothetical protein
MFVVDRVNHRFAAFASTRLALVVVGAAVLAAFPAHPVESWMGLSFPDHNWIDGWVRWDSFWYESIVDPHPRFVPSYLSNANFFPFYAWVSWIVSLPFRAFLDLEHAFFIGALIVSSASFVLGLKAVERFTIAVAGREVAMRTVWLIAVFPFSFFFTAVYADALYFCLCAWSLTLAVEGRWYPACALAAMAVMTRIPGVALLPALVLEYARQQANGRTGQQANRRTAIACLAILAIGPIVIATYYQWRYGNPLEFIHARQVGWNRASGIAGYARDFNYFFASPILNCSGIADCVKEFAPTRALLGAIYLLLVPVSIGVVISGARTIGVAATTFALVSIALALPNGFDGMGRFTLVLFPFFISLALLLRKRGAFVTVCVVCVPLLLMFFAQFARWRQVL